MPHLLKDASGNIFETKVPERVSSVPEEAGKGVSPAPYYGAERPQQFAIGVDMTPDQARETNLSNYPRRDVMDVRNVARPRRGYGY